MDASFGAASAERARRRLEGVTRAGVLARWAAVPIVITTMVSGVTHVTRSTWIRQVRGPHFPLTALASTLVSVASIVLFAMWLHRAVANTSLLGSPVAWRPAQAVTSFFIPFVGFYRPYRIVTDVYRASDPVRAPDTPSFVSKVGVHYRESAVERVVAPRWRYAAPIGAWWSVYMLKGFVGGAVSRIFGDGLTATVATLMTDMTACALCLLVMRSINARQRELCRRLEAAEGGSRAANVATAAS
jgi:hypothetical protein